MENKSFFEKLQALGADNFKAAFEDDIFTKPIVIDRGTTVLPISKISYGYVGGNGGFQAKNNKDNSLNASGCGITVTPLGLLICGEENTYIKIGGEMPEDKWASLLKCVIDTIKK